MPPAKDLTGQKFGKLTALRRAGRSPKGLRLWLLECECGTKIKRIVADVVRGNTRSCGCLGPNLVRERNLKLLPNGARFGRWVILEYLGTNEHRASYYKVRCECGSIRSVGRQSLVEGTSVSCGCFMVDSLIQRITTHGRSKTKEYKAEWTRRRRAKRRINGGSHTFEEATHLRYKVQKNKCHYCNKPLDLFDTIHEDHKVPISRGGSNAISNIAITCPRCNLCKHTKTEKEFLKQLKEESGA